MKKLLAIILLLLAVSFAFTACKEEHIHSFGEWSVTKNPTCTQDGEKTRYCSCGEMQRDVIPAVGHTEEIIPAKNATCTENGLTDGTICSVCGTTITPQQTIETLGHNYVNNICEKCGDTIVTGTAGLYDANDNLIAFWDELVNTYGMNVSIDYTYDNIETRVSSPYYVLTKNSKLSSGVKLIIDDNVKKIGNCAFVNCYHLTSVVIGNSVTTIGEAAFDKCGSLTSVKIGSSVTTIGEAEFNSCKSLISIEVDENNEYYKSIDGNLYSKDGKTLIQYAIGKTATNFEILDGVTTIGNNAFQNCTSLESIVIPNSVTTIGNFAFYRCTSLTSVVIPDSVETIGNYAFYNCTSLMSVVIPDGVTTIGDWAFFGCQSLTSVVIPDSVTTIGSDAFSYCNKLSFNKYGNCNYLGSENNPYFALIGVTNQNLSNYEIHPDTKIIADGAFSNCDSLTSVVIGNSVTTIGDGAFYSCGSLTSVVIGDSVTTIGEKAFHECDNLTSIVIPDSVTTIGDNAFAYCYSLTSIVIPNSVTTIGKYAFYGCDRLTDVYYTGSEEEWAKISIGSSNSKLKNAEIHYNYVPEE